MKILLVEKHPVPKLAASLGGGGHVASSMKDEKTAFTALTGGAFQMLLISLRGMDAAVVGMLEGVRKTTACKSLYVVIIAHESPDDFLVRLLRSAITAMAAIGGGGTRSMSTRWEPRSSLSTNRMQAWVCGDSPNASQTAGEALAETSPMRVANYMHGAPK